MNRCVNSLVIVLCLLMSSYLFADFNVKEWKYFKNIENINRDAEYNKIKIDTDIYNRANVDLSDIRIVDDENKESAYNISVNFEQTNQLQLSPKILNKSYNQKHTMFIVDFGKSGIENNEIVINSKNINYRRIVEIYGSDDLSQDDWKVIRKDGCIFNVTNKSYTSNHLNIDYPINIYRYLKIIINQNGEKEPFIVENVFTYMNKTIAGKEEEYTFKVIKKHINKLENATEILLDFEKNNIPTHKIKVNSSNKNYHRNVVIETSNDSNNWDKVCSDSIYDYLDVRYRDKKDIVTFQEVKCRYIKILIYYYDDKPIEINNLNVYGYVRNIIFKTNKNKNYRLFYGNSDARTPKYDIEYLAKYVNKHNVNLAVLGKEEIRIDEVVLPKAKPFHFEKYILWLIIILISAGLIYLASKIYKKIN